MCTPLLSVKVMDASRNALHNFLPVKSGVTDLGFQSALLEEILERDELTAFFYSEALCCYHVWMSKRCEQLAHSCCFVRCALDCTLDITTAIDRPDKPGTVAKTLDHFGLGCQTVCHKRIIYQKLSILQINGNVSLLERTTKTSRIFGLTLLSSVCGMEFCE